MSDLFTLFTPPHTRVTQAHPNREERYSVDSGSSAASSTLQTPDRANFPRFTSPAVAAEASCATSSVIARVGAGDVVVADDAAEGQDEEKMWDGMEAGGLLEVKIGNLLNLTPRLSTCFLPAITPSSDLAFDQDYEVQPDDSPLLPATYVSPCHAFKAIPQFTLPAPEAFAASSRRVRSNRTRPSTSDAAANTTIPFAAKSAVPVALADPFTPASASMGRSTSDNVHARPMPYRGLGPAFGPASASSGPHSAVEEAHRINTKRQSQGQVPGRKEYLGRLSFGDASLSIPLPPVFSGQTHNYHEGEGGAKAQLEKIAQSDALQAYVGAEEAQERLQEDIPEETDGNHLSSPISSSASIASSKLFYSTAHTRYPSSSSSFSFTPSVHSNSTASSRRSGPPRSIPSRTSSRQSSSGTRPPPPTAFSPPPRTSSLAKNRNSARLTSGIARGGGDRAAYDQQRRNRASVYTVASVISDRSEIAPSPPKVFSTFGQPRGLNTFRFPATRAGTCQDRRQAVYLCRKTSNPLDIALTAQTEARQYVQLGSRIRITRSRSHTLPLRRSRSTPDLRNPSGDMSKWVRVGRGLRESHSFTSTNDNSIENSSRWASQNLLKSPASPAGPSTKPNAPSPGSPFKSRASRFGLSDFWGTKLNPQGIMHIAEPRSSRREDQYSEDKDDDMPSPQNPSINIDLDLDLGSELDFSLELQSDPLAAQAPLTPEDAAVITPTRPRHVRTRSQRGIEVLAAARKARLLESSSSRALNVDQDDYAVADILSEIEAEDQEYSILLAEREDDAAAWREAHTWDWPMPPFRPEPTKLPVVPILQDEAEVNDKGHAAKPAQGKGLGLTLSHSHMSGLQVREPKFLKPRGASKTGKRSTNGKNRSSLKSLSSDGSLTSAESAQSVAEFALLTPATINGPSGTSYVDIDIDDMGADSQLASLAAPTIHVDSPSTPIAPSLSLDAEPAMDMDVTPKAPSRHESLRSIAQRSTSNPSIGDAAPARDAQMVPKSFMPLKDEDEGQRDVPETLKVTPRKYGSSVSLPLIHAPLSGSASLALSNLSLAPCVNGKSKTFASRADVDEGAGQNIGEFGESLEVGDADHPVRERKESAFKAWTRRRKESKKEAQAEMQAAKAARARAQAEASGLLSPIAAVSSDNKANAVYGNDDSSHEQGGKGGKGGSTGRASGLELLGAVALLSPSTTLRTVKPQRSTLSLRSTATTASASAPIPAGSERGSPSALGTGTGSGTHSASGSIKSGKAKKRLNHLDLLTASWGGLV